MRPLPTKLYTPESVRRIDQSAINKHGIPGYTLMRRAGKAVLEVLSERYPPAKKILILCGAGNNAGDGYVIARLAQQQGLDIRVVSLIEPEKLQGDALTAFQQWNETASLAVNDIALIEGADVIIDALLGTGLTRDVEAAWLNWIDAVNYSDKPVISVDVPSGIDALTGTIRGAAIVADITVTFIAMKSGLFTASGKACCGEVVFDSLAVPESVHQDETPIAELLSDHDQLAKRRHDTHKGLHGHVLLVGGNDGMPGAVILAAKAALRSGAGMVTVVTRLEHVAAVAAVAAACPEAMVYGSTHGDLPDVKPDKLSLVAIGPGLGTDTWAHRLLVQANKLNLPMVIDADALNLVAENRLKINAPHIMTPHPGEAARLLSVDTATIQQDRFAAIKQLQKNYDGVMVLKGSGSLVFDGERIAVCPFGNPAMAVAGMGDVLTGVIAAFVAQGMDLSEAARAAVVAHARAADLAAGDDTRGLLASDVIEQLRQVVN